MFGISFTKPVGDEVGFFQEAPRKDSSARLFSFCVMLFLFYFDYLLQQKKDFVIDQNFILWNVIGFIAVFAPKYLQKLAELKFGPVSANKETQTEKPA